MILQKRELEKRLNEKYIEREARLKEIQRDIIKVIIGPRRAGKSFFAVHELGRVGGFGYVNFDDEKLVDVKDYNEIVSVVDSVYDNPKYLLLDEIQNLGKWELFVNRLQRQGYKIILTGSNSNLLSRELSTHLTGRHTQVSIFPFSFREFIKNEGKALTENEIREKLHEYIIHGGYPEPTVKKLDYKDYLSTLFDSILYKDIVKRHRIRSVQSMEDLTLYLLSNIAKEFSYTTLTKVTKVKSVHTVEKYLGYLEESFLFFKLNRFSHKFREQVNSNKKIYCIDNGFIHAKAFKTSADTGKLYENAVAIELTYKEPQEDTKTYFWKSQQQEEVDFLIKKEQKVIQLIQVCYDVSNPETKKREERALIKASKELKCKDLLVITGNYEAEKEAEWYGIKGKIKYTPLWKWLLQDHQQT